MYRDIIRTISAELSRDNLENQAKQIFDLDRVFTYPNFKRSAAYCASRLTAAGVSDVQTIPHRADGKTTSFDTIMPEAWDAVEARLEIVEPAGANGCVLADTRETFLALANRSAPTPTGGLVAEVVSEEMFKTGTAIKGKLLFVSSIHPREIRQDVVKKGGAGIISCFMPNAADTPDATFWINGWSGGPGWYQTAEESPLICFSITPRRGDYLRSLLVRHGRVEVRAFVKSRLYSDYIDTVTGRIPGGSDDELLLLAHIYEPFANDNAVGASAVIEIMRAIRILMDGKKLPPLKRSIRGIISQELYGFSAYLTEYIKEHRAIAAVNLDGISIDHRITGEPLKLIMNPASQPHFGDLLLASMFRNYFAETAPSYPMMTTRGSLIADNFPADRTIDIPTNWLWQPEAQCWHTTLNDFSRTDWASSMSIITLVASYCYLLASVGDNGISWLMEDTALEGKRIIYHAVREMSASKAVNSPDKVRRRMAFVADWQVGRVRSVSRLGANDVQRARIEELSQEIADIAASESDRLCNQMGKDERSLLSKEQKLARNIIYTRLTLGMPHSLARVPIAERVPLPWGALEALNWMDGKRDLLEIAGFVEQEMSEPIDDCRLSGLIHYFALLEKCGYLGARRRTNLDKKQ